MLIDTSYTGSSVTVSMWSTKVYDSVKTECEPAAQRHLSRPTVDREAGPECIATSGLPGSPRTPGASSARTVKRSSGRSSPGATIAEPRFICGKEAVRVAGGPRRRDEAAVAVGSRSLAVGLFAINVVARWSSGSASTATTTAAGPGLASSMFAAIGAGPRGRRASSGRSRDAARRQWLRRPGRRGAIGGLLLTILVGPFISGEGPFAGGAGDFFAQIWLYGGFADRAARCSATWVAIALGRDYRSKSLKRVRPRPGAEPSPAAVVRARRPEPAVLAGQVVWWVREAQPAVERDRRRVALLDLQEGPVAPRCGAHWATRRSRAGPGPAGGPAAPISTSEMPSQRSGPVTVPRADREQLAALVTDLGEDRSRARAVSTCTAAAGSAPLCSATIASQSSVGASASCTGGRSARCGVAASSRPAARSAPASAAGRSSRARPARRSPARPAASAR